MPSPIGHALAGVAVAWAAEQLPGSAGLKRPFSLAVTLSSVALAVVPDADLIYTPIHRTVTHSVSATISVTILAIAVTGKVTRLSTLRRAQGSVAWGVVLMCAAAHASHILLDWLGADPSLPSGIQALWPFSYRWFISGWELFPGVERRQMLSAASIVTNLNAVAWEVALMGPIVLALGWLRAKRARRAGRTETAGRAGR